jgi:hypothetical protein
MNAVTNLEKLNLPAAQLIAALSLAIKELELYGAADLELGDEVLIQLVANEYPDENELGEIIISY